MLRLLLALLFALPMLTPSAQGQPGAQPDIWSTKPATRAVVVGISDYQDEGIPDLRFADRDAEAFASWLQSEAGESLPASQITLLTNGRAKVGNIVAALTWLLDECQADERAIIYFSGHGDVEKATMFQRGYLLAYDMPPTNYMAGGINVRDIQDVVSTLSNRGVQVVIVTDACRAGKLAGSLDGSGAGAQATTAALQQQFANEVKILSCQPDEFSIEGEQWGGGRGAFSYHLIDGLCGLADRNADQQVSLLEIGNYLQEAVPRETAPQSQMPMTLGNPRTMLASVSEQALLAVRTKKAGEPPSLHPVEQKGMEDMVLAKADSSIQQLYRAFLAAIERGDLMPTDTGGKSADYYYRILIAEPELAQMHGLMKRNFAAALQNESQAVTNKLLKTDPNVVSDIWSRPFVFDHIPAYLERAGEILGEGHFFYKYLKAKQLFFEGLTAYTKDSTGIISGERLQVVSDKMEAALKVDSSAAFIYSYLSWFYIWDKRDLEKSLRCAKRAVELSPNWALAHINAGFSFGSFAFQLHDSILMSNAERHLLKALELDSAYLPAYQALSWCYWLVKPDSARYRYYRDKVINSIQKMLDENPEKVCVAYRLSLGIELWKASRDAEAAIVMEECVKMTQQKWLSPYQFLGPIYYNLGQREKACGAAKKQIELNPFNPEGYYQLGSNCARLMPPGEMIQYLEAGLSLPEIRAFGNSHTSPLNLFLGRAYQEIGKQEEAKAQFKQVLELLPNLTQPFDIYNTGGAHLGLGDLDALKRTIDEGLKKFPGDAMVYYHAGCLYSLAKQEQQSLDWLQQAIEKGFGDFRTISGDADLAWIREKPGFKALMKKYFPDKVKD